MVKTPVVYDNNTGWPTRATCYQKPWGDFYLTYAVNEAFGMLWNNKNKLLDRFETYWSTVAAAFKDNKFVIGYEIMNEPWPGDLYKNPLVMVPGFTEYLNMQNAYDRISAAIRKVDPNHNICFEPATWLNNYRSGFTHPPGGFKYSNSSILCYHYYDSVNLNYKKTINARVRDIKRLRTGGILSEFFISGPKGPNNTKIMEECDRNSHSWFGWQYISGLPIMK